MAEGRREIKGALDAKMVTTAEQMRESLDVIAALEPGFAAAIARVGYPPPRVRTPGYETLLRTIVGQQVSVASAAAVWRKLEAELGEGCDFTVLGKLKLHRARHLLHGLDLSGRTDS